MLRRKLVAAMGVFSGCESHTTWMVCIMHFPPMAKVIVVFMNGWAVERLRIGLHSG